MGWRSGIAWVAHVAAEAAAETLWPTRCALCDLPGNVLCERCRRRLPYLDWWRACRRCGSPFGLVQCDLCNPDGLSRLGIEELPFAACASATVFSEASGQVVRVFKDLGEQRLALCMAEAMAQAVPPDWSFDVVTFVPSTLAAYRHRGFDHAQLLAQALGPRLSCGVASTLQRPRTRDQRGLNGRERVKNLGGSLTAHSPAVRGSRLLLVDDVMTTGATLCAASTALLAAGAAEVRCLTFARV